MLTFVETALFTRLVSGYLTDDEYLMLQLALAANPEAGAVIRGSGGVRKMRWGVRRAEGQVWMLTLYAKNETDSIPASVLKRTKEELDAG